MSTYELQPTFKKLGHETRDAKLRCIRCGSFAAGRPMCDKCVEEVIRGVEARRRRMQLTFYYILIMAVVTYYFIL
jgi:predicted nucleic acid-binding Zn ribbon protein